jgi:hypothetical protein
VKARLQAALAELKAKYAVPEGIPAPRVGVDPMRYYSSQRKLLESLNP